MEMSETTVVAEPQAIYSGSPLYRDNLLLKETFELSVKTIRFVNQLGCERAWLIDQFERSACSPGANSKEAQNAESLKDFIHKLKIALKEADEAEYWYYLIAATQDKETTILRADGDLQATKLAAEGIRVEGNAKADAEKALQLAPVAAQIELAKEIGQNEGYQAYLISIRGVEAYTQVGVEQAKAIAGADVKVIANTGDAVQGVSDAMALVSVLTPQRLGAKTTDGDYWRERGWEGAGG